MSDQDQPLRIEVSIRVTAKQGYDTREIAIAKVEDQAAWPVATALQAIVDDATDRAYRQIRAEHVKRVAIENAREEFTEPQSLRA